MSISSVTNTVSKYIYTGKDIAGYLGINERKQSALMPELKKLRYTMRTYLTLLDRAGFVQISLKNNRGIVLESKVIFKKERHDYDGWVKDE